MTKSNFSPLSPASSKGPQTSQCRTPGCGSASNAIVHYRCDADDDDDDDDDDHDDDDDDDDAEPVVPDECGMSGPPKEAATNVHLTPSVSVAYKTRVISCKKVQGSLLCP
eukprot:5391512-Amphidinium_carterae.1